MSKWYRVTVTQVIDYVVELEDDESEEEAADLALSACSMDGDRTAETELLEGPAAVASAKRHADQVISLDD
jgi:hypothetical protein